MSRTHSRSALAGYAAPTGLPQIVVVPHLSQPFSSSESELMLVGEFSSMGEGSYLAELDETVGGAITRAVAENNFAFTRGEHMLIDVTTALDAPSCKLILLVGLGELGTFNGRMVCGLFGLALDKAREERVEQLIVPISSQRITQRHINLKGTLALLKCRTFEAATIHGRFEHLKTIAVLCAAQAQHHIQEGLASPIPLCSYCTEPQICEAQQG